MSEEGLTPELQSLLAAEKEAAGPDGGARDRVARRLAQTLGVTLAAAGASSAATSGAQTVLPKALLGKSLVAKLLVAALVGTVGVGAVVGTVKLLQHRHARTLAPPAAPSPPPPTVVAPAPVAPAVVTPPSLSAVEEPAEPSTVAATSPAHTETHRAPRHANLAAERALLTEARTAMQASDAPRALAILDDHAHRFPRGQLAEERDALRVAALWLAGDRAAARRHADDFARHHPGSLFLPSVQHTVTAE